MDLHDKYNDFFVKCFNLILKREKEMLLEIDKSLSGTEIHVIESIAAAEENNTSKRVAELLRVSPGTLTTSIGTLCKKGYVLREQDAADKRVVRLFLTEKGKNAHKIHMAFHKRMIECLLKDLSEKEANSLISALEKLKDFLGDYNAKR
ncbi:MAG: MarR family transcriptional regulator [Bacillota bacterium]|nr:MAG: MarR family transcriptional regulator [Bacillota bacterium]